MFFFFPVSIQLHENMTVQWRQFLPSGSFQTQMLYLIYCETTIATWCLTFWRRLLRLKASSGKWEMLMLSQCQASSSVAGNKRLKNTVVCQRKGNSGLCFHFVWLLFCLWLHFVCFFAYVWCRVVGRVGGHSLRHLEPANSRSVIQPVSLSSRVMPPWRGWHTLVEHTLPGRKHID